MLSPLTLSGSVLSRNHLGFDKDTGVGGTVTQITSKATGVTLNKSCGQITTHAASLADATSVVFTLTNNTILAGDMVRVMLISGAASAGTYQVWAEASVAGAVTVCIRNVSGGALAEALVLGFTVIRTSTT